jgi:hypothetical protein
MECYSRREEAKPKIPLSSVPARIAGKIVDYLDVGRRCGTGRAPTLSVPVFLETSDQILRLAAKGTI